MLTPVPHKSYIMAHGKAVFETVSPSAIVEGTEDFENDANIIKLFELQRTSYLYSERHCPCH